LYLRVYQVTPTKVHNWAHNRLHLTLAPCDVAVQVPPSEMEYWGAALGADWSADGTHPTAGAVDGLPHTLALVLDYGDGGGLTATFAGEVRVKRRNMI